MDFSYNTVLKRKANPGTFAMVTCIAILSMQCSDEQMDPYYYVEPPCVYGVRFYLDSATRVTETTATIWAHIAYDSLLIVKSRSGTLWEVDPTIVEFWNGVNPLTEDILSEPDTVDFRTLTTLHNEVCTSPNERVYSYSFEWTNLKRDKEYFLELTNVYSAKGQTSTSVLFTQDF